MAHKIKYKLLHGKATLIHIYIYAVPGYVVLYSPGNNYKSTGGCGESNNSATRIQDEAMKNGWK